MIIPKSRFAYLLQLSVLFLSFSFLLILNTSTNDFVNPTLQKSLAAALTLVALIWVAAGQRGRQPAGKALLVWVAVYVLVILFSLDPRRSASQMVLMSISVLLFSLSADLAARGWPRELFVKTLLMVGAVVILLGLLEAGFWYARWLQSAPGEWIPDILYRPGSANVIAMFLNLMLMLAGARLLVTRAWPARVALLALILPALFLLYLTSSRGGWLGTAAGLAVLAGLALYTGQLDWRTGWRFLRDRPLLLGLLVVMVVVASGVGGAILYQRTLHPSHGPVAMARADYWPPAWETFLNSPLVGSGPFTYSNAFISHNSTPPWILFIHSHGTPFNLLAEMGLAGAAGLLFLVGSILVGLWQRLRVVEGAERGVLVGALAAVTASGVHSLFDCFHTETIGLWTLCIVLGASLGRPGSTPRFGRLQNGWALLVVLGLWVEVWLTAPLFAGTEQANSGRWQESAETFTQAVQRDPASVIAWQQRALANSVLVARGQPGTLDQALRDLEMVVRLEPGWALNHANLGALYLTDNRPDEAARALEESLRRAPGCGLCALNLGVAYEASGNQAGAQQAYQQALAAGQPALAYFWRGTPQRQQAQAAWLAQHPLEAGSAAELSAKLKANPSNARPYLELAALALHEGRLAEAQDLINRSALAYSIEPETGLEQEWLSAELLARKGNLPAALQRGSAVIARYRMAGLYGPGSLGQLYYAPLMFRRPAMALELAPQLVRIEMPDAWGKRVALLAEWAEQSGDADQAWLLRHELKALVPDFSGN